MFSMESVTKVLKIRLFKLAASCERDEKMPHSQQETGYRQDL